MQLVNISDEIIAESLYKYVSFDLITANRSQPLLCRFWSKPVCH